MSKIHLTLEERETIILYNEADDTATVYTHNAALKRKLAGFASASTEAVKEKEDDYAVTYRLPKKWVKINKTVVLSDEEKARRAEIARAMVKKRVDRLKAVT